MSLQGKEIYRSYDEFGAVRVLDDGNKRYLAFGDHDEQSCWFKHDPYLPQHDYVRTMLLALLFCNPKQSISLGLGGGSLNSCLHFHYPELKQQVIELRPAVIEVAYRYFQLPRSKRLEVQNLNAVDYLQAPTGKKADVLFSDIYTVDGLDEQQLQPEYLRRCHDLLKPEGWLVLNCWREHRESGSLNTLRQLFADIRTCTTQDGNWIIFAGKTPSRFSNKQLKANAQQLSQKFGFAMTPYLARMKTVEM